jgi:signal transduction histidine kinase
MLAGVVSGLLLLGLLGHSPSPEQRWWFAGTVLVSCVAALSYPVLTRLLARGLDPAERVGGGDDDPGRELSPRSPDPNALEDILVGLVDRFRATHRLAAVQLWVGTHGVYRLVVATPPSASPPLTLTSAQERMLARMAVVEGEWLSIWLPALTGGREHGLLLAAPVCHTGELLGFVVAEQSPTTNPRRAAAERRLTATTAQELSLKVGPLLEAFRLGSELRGTLETLKRQADELEHSRARLVRAADDERQRLERDLHDGVQQQLVAVSLGLRLVREELGSGRPEAAAQLEGLEGDLERALADLRALAHGVYPPLLRDQGLQAVLADAARRAPLQTQVGVALARRHEPPVEAAVYFCCLEAINNACKHAGPDAQIRVSVWEQAGALLFEVADNGRGLDGEANGGLGLLSVRDRVGALGGSLSIDSGPGRGVRIAATLPVR